MAEALGRHEDDAFPVTPAQTERMLQYWQGYPYPLPYHAKGCGLHGEADLWKSIHGGTFCRICYPPADAGLEAQK